MLSPFQQWQLDLALNTQKKPRDQQEEDFEAHVLSAESLGGKDIQIILELKVTAVIHSRTMIHRLRAQHASNADLDTIAVIPTMYLAATLVVNRCRGEDETVDYQEKDCTRGGSNLQWIP